MTKNQFTSGSEHPIAAGEMLPPRLLNSQAGSSLVLVCEHASRHIPAQFNALGLPPQLWDSHIAWDPGALAVAEHLSRMLDARLVASSVSRLVYDCNRPPEAPDAMPARSGGFAIPGNAGLSDADKAHRVNTCYTPFDALLTAAVAAIRRQPGAAALITIHSFTPVYQGRSRSTEVGVLHDSDTRLADAMLALAPNHSPLLFRRNDPYGPADGVTHTLRRHGLGNGLMNVMLEIRNDLIAAPEQQRTMAGMLAALLQQALGSVVPQQSGAPAPGADRG